MAMTQRSCDARQREAQLERVLEPSAARTAALQWSGDVAVADAEEV
jgi:hypothetical protein